MCGISIPRKESHSYNGFKMHMRVIVIFIYKNFLRRLVTLLSKESEAFLVNFKPQFTEEFDLRDYYSYFNRLFNVSLLRESLSNWPQFTKLPAIYLTFPECLPVLFHSQNDYSDTRNFPNSNLSSVQTCSNKFPTFNPIGNFLPRLMCMIR